VEASTQAEASVETQTDPAHTTTKEKTSNHDALLKVTVDTMLWLLKQLDITTSQKPHIKLLLQLFHSLTEKADLSPKKSAMETGETTTAKTQSAPNDTDPVTPKNKGGAIKNTQNKTQKYEALGARPKLITNNGP
jgi:hypothetical protein